MVGTWLQKMGERLLGSGSRRSRRLQSALAARQARMKIRPTLEALEDRLSPALAHTTYVLMHHSGATPANNYSYADDGFSPPQILEAYGLYSSSGTNNISFNGVAGNGAGQTIAIVDAYDDPNIAGDLAAFDTEFNLPAPATFSVLNENGGTSLPAPDPTGGWETEESLDVEWAHAIAPGASIVVVEATSQSLVDLDTSVTTAANLSGVSVASMSYGWPEASVETGEDGIYTTPSGHQGVTFLAASGDNGSPSIYPAYSPNVVAVGGTSLYVNSLNSTAPPGGSYSYQSETGWGNGSNSPNAGGSGGGISLYENEPSYQDSVQSTGMRTSPDVSFGADPNTGVAIYDSYDNPSGPWTGIGGTSVATPCMGAIMAIVNQGRVAEGSTTLNGATQTLPGLYSLPSTGSSNAFHLITSGDNGGYSANANGTYNEVTGIGTPMANVFIPDMVNYDNVPHLVITTPPPANVAVDASFGFSATVDIGTNVDTSFSGNVTVSLQNNPGGSALSGSQLTIPVTNGVAAFSGLALNDAGTGYTLAVSGTGLTTVATPSFNVVNWIVADPSDNAGSPTDITLPYALSNAQNGDTIIFANDLSGDTITLSNALTIDTNVTITGLGAANLAISGNNAVEVFNIASGVTASISGLTVENGAATRGGGIDNNGTLTLANSTLAGNSAADSGGGICNNGAMTLSNSTVAGNSASQGGGIANLGTLTLNNATLAGNSASSQGGGIDNNGSLTLSNVSVSANTAAQQGGGIDNGNTSPLTLLNTIAAANTATTGPDISGTVVVANDDMIGDTSGMTITSGTGIILNPSNPGLGTLGNNGGPTQTIPLLSGSPAIGAGGALTSIAAGHPVGAADTTIYVQNAAAIAATPGSYYILIGQEEMLVTNVDTTTNTLTVQRGVNGTTAATQPVGASVYLATDQRGSARSTPPDMGAFQTPITVTSSTINIADNSTTITINGAGFATTLAGNTVTFNLGVVGSVTSATSTELIVTISTPPTALGALTAVITANGRNSGAAVQVATEVSGTWMVATSSGSAGSLTNVTLPYAVAHALNGDQITFASNLSGATITLSSSLTIGQNISITGLGAANLAVSGNNAVQVFTVFPGVTTSISNLKIENADGVSGGGIDNLGTLTLSNDTITGNNTATSGGGVFNNGTLMVSDSTFANNSAAYGGGLGNSGLATVTGSTFTGNTASSTSGGGILNYNGTLTLSNSTLANNTAATGAGIDNYAGTVTLSDDTIADNTATNAGGGIYNAAGNTMTMLNTIVAGNHLNGAASDVNGTIAVADDDLIGTSSGMTITSGTGNHLNVSAGLASALANNGGPTQTLALLSGSAAIGNGGAVTRVATGHPVGFSDTTIYVANAAAISQATPGSYTILVDQEQMLVTSVNTTADTLTVQRGVNGTTAATHADSAGVYLATDQRGVTRSTPSSIGAYEFVYVTPPTVTGLSPTSGPTSGGTSVIITGTNFTGATAVHFGNTAATTFTVNSPTQITATSPAGGSVDNVTVTTPTGGTSANSSADQFTYLGTAVTGVNPNTGPMSGGTIVTITGTDFSAATAVMFGATAAATFTVDSDTQITATSPAGAGSVHVTVTTPTGGTSTTSSADLFRYSVAVTSSTTNVADSSTTIIITGAGFSTTPANTTVAFNLGVGGAVTAATTTQLTVTLSAPPTALGSLTAVVTSNGSNSGAAVQVATEVAGNWVVGSSSGGAGTLGVATLPYAVAHALNGDQITFASGLSGSTITLSSTLTIDHNITITGLGAANLAVSGNHAVGVFVVNSGVTASISNLKIENAEGNSGGGIDNLGTLTLSNDTIAGNTSATSGGGVFNTGTLTVSDSTFANNTAAYGGGLGNSGLATVTGSTFTGNSASSTGGGGILNYNGTLTLSNSTLANNTAATGGGINNYTGSVTLSDDTIADNTDFAYGGGGVYNGPGNTMTILNSIVAGNHLNGAANDVNGSIAVADDDLIGTSSGMTITSGSGNHLNVSAGLASALANNGGPTQTLALLSSSAAIGNGGALTTVAAGHAVGIADTTIYVSNAAAIAETAGSYTILIGQEQMLVTSVNTTTNTLTVQRGVNGTTAATHNVAASVYFATDQRGINRPTPADIGAFQLAPTVGGISPSTGPSSGGTSVIIIGTNFTGATAVKFGAANATTFTVSSATQITATSPVGAGVVDVTVTTPTGGTSATSSVDHFTYVAAPTVTNLSPNTGPAAGGTSVIITGTNFTGATLVKFGNTNATSFIVNSATQITAVAPSGTSAVDVTVIVPIGGTSMTSAADLFTYVPPVAVTSVTVNGDLLNVTSSITAAVENAGSTTVQITTSSADGYYVGELVQISNVGTAAFNGTYAVASVVDATDFTFTDANFDATSPGSISNGGTAVNALGGVQRSMVDSIAYQFNQAVTLSSGAITMDVNSGYTGTTGTLPGDISYSTIDDGHTWLVTFSGTNVTGNSIADGVYDITLNADDVTSNPGSGMLASSRTDTFFRLFGDSNGDASVTGRPDVQWLASAFGSSSTASAYLAYFDYDADGSISGRPDVQNFAARFGTSLSGFTATI